MQSFQRGLPPYEALEPETVDYRAGGRGDTGGHVLELRFLNAIGPGRAAESDQANACVFQRRRPRLVWNGDPYLARELGANPMHLEGR